MSDRKDYGRKREVELGTLEDGRSRYAELRFDPVHGLVTDCCVGYKVWNHAEYAEIVRYDSAHEVFHRHKEGYPEPGEACEWFPDTPMNERGRLAVDHARKNGLRWHSVLPIPVKSDPEESPT